MTTRVDPRGRHGVFFFNRADLVQGNIVHVPAATGDCWIVEDSAGKTHFIQNFERMELGGIMSVLLEGEQDGM